MIKAKDKPVGIDATIQRAQVQFHNAVKAKWGIANDSDLIVFGRCERRREGNDYRAQWFNGNDYADVYADDTLTAVAFFGTGQRTRSAIGETADVHLVVFVDTQKVKPVILHRADEEVRVDVQNIFGKNFFGLTYVSTETGVENCLREYRATALQMIQDYKFDNPPRHAFRLNFTAYYDKNQC